MAKQLSNVYDLQLLLYAVLSLIHLAMSLYYVYIDIRSSTDSLKLSFNLVTIIVIDRALNFTKLCIVSYDCEYTMKQVRIVQHCNDKRNRFT